MSDVTEDKCDVFVDYVQEKLPSGVQVQFELVGIFVSRGWEDVCMHCISCVKIMSSSCVLARIICGK